MIRAIANKRLDLSNDEFEYYKILLEKYGADSFRSLFDTDQNGIIISVSPPLDGQTPMAVMFYMLNVMFTQRMRLLDLKISKFDELEKKVDQVAGMANLLERRMDGKN